MTIEVRHCPYCNATLTLTEAEAIQRRIYCSHCGDSFLNKASTAITAGASNFTHPSLGYEANGELPEPKSLRLSNASIARIIVLIMFVMGSIGLLYALATVGFRRSNDNKGRAATLSPLRSEHVMYAPLQLPALGYLPADCVMVAGLHLHQLESRPAGEQATDLLEDLKLKKSQELLSQWTGFELKEIDHIALGLRLRNELPELIIVVRTRTPYTPERIAEHFAPNKGIKFENLPAFRFTTKMLLGGWVWCINPNTLVVELGMDSKPASLSGIRTEPAMIGEHLLPEVRTLIEQRLDPTSFLWIVGDVAKAHKLIDLLNLFSQKSMNLGEPLKQMKSFALGVHFEEGIRTAVQLQAVDMAAGQALERKLREIVPDDSKIKITGPKLIDAQDGADSHPWISLLMQAPAKQIRVVVQSLLF